MARAVGLRRLLVLVIALGVVTPSVVAGAPRKDGRTFWDEYRRTYPRCTALTDQHERLTDELDRLDEQARQAREPQRTALVRQVNATAKERNQVQDQLFACARASGAGPFPAASGQPRPPLQGRVEETDTPTAPPTGPAPGGPSLPGFGLPIPGWPAGQPGGGPRTPPGGGPSPSGPAGSPPGAPTPGAPPRGPSVGGPAPIPDRNVPVHDAPSYQRGLTRGFVECLHSLQNVGLAALALVNPPFILQNRNYVDAAKYLGLRSSDQGLRFLFQEASNPTLRGGFTQPEACAANVGDEEAGLRIARRICFWSWPNPVYKAIKGARAAPRPPPGLPGSPTNPLTEAEVVQHLQATSGDLSGQARDLSGQTIALPPGEGGLKLGNVTLGERLGEGKFKDVYAIDGRPGLTLQIAHNTSDAALSVQREIVGYNLIKGDIATPTVHDYRGAAGGLSYLIKDRLPSDAFFSQPTPEVLAGMGATQAKLVGGNRVWVDSHLANHYLTRDAQGRPIVGIHDTDMITRATDPAVASQFSRLLGPFQEAFGSEGLPKLYYYECQARAGTLDATAFMRDVWRARYRTAPPF
jgi:hypothetical protein